ncbi:mitotic fidelity of chromosome transmission- protein [Recurvomyces mirabilis]|nr:mitotic fidelity of chromosome transmission- protein [Recurvomyces mirabilis]
MAVMDLDKENRPPQSTSVEANNKNTGGRVTLTPSRLLQRQKKQDQYFEVGKVGRKTGLTLPDNGVRDEYGLEPVSGIFDSPIKSPQHSGDHDLTSGSDMHMQESSATEADRALQMRKTPKLPPPRASTPKHTNIGSPKRMSTGRQPHTTGKPLIPRDREGTTSPERQLSRTQPPANRTLNFREAGVAKSIESLSPFKPKKSLRRSMARQDPFASPEPAMRGIPRSKSVAEAIETAEETARWISTDDSPIVQQNTDDWQPIVDDDLSVQPEEGDSELPRQASPSTQLSARPSSSQSDSPERTLSGGTNSASRKRLRRSMEGEQDAKPPVNKAGRRRTTVFDSPVAETRQSRNASDESVLLQDDGETGSIDPSLVAQSEQYSVHEASAEPIEPPAKKSKTKSRAAALKERDPNRPSRLPGSPIKLNDVPGTSSKSPSKRPGSRGLSLGPSNNLNFRATTPFKDATGTSRFGRPIIQPLQYWANETRVWKNGECEGIIRAEEVVKPKPKKKGRKKKRKTTTRLDDIDEECETESVMADEWEQEMGVIAGTVANWDPATQSGNASDPIKEGK